MVNGQYGFDESTRTETNLPSPLGNIMAGRSGWQKFAKLLQLLFITVNDLKVMKCALTLALKQGSSKPTKNIGLGSSFLMFYHFKEIPVFSRFNLSTCTFIQ